MGDREGTGAFFRRALIVAAMIGVALLVWKLAGLLLLIFGGALLAMALRAGGDFLCRHTGLPRRVGVIVVLIGVLAVVGGLGWLVGDKVGEQFQELSKTLPLAMDKFRDWLANDPVGAFLVQQTKALEGAPTGLFARLGGFASQVFSSITDFVLVVVVMVFLALEPTLYIRGLVRLFPIPVRPRVTEVLHAVGRALTHWLLGQGIAMLAVGAVTTIGLLLLDIPLALALGMLALLLEFIPFVGPVLAAVPAILFAFTVSPPTALYVTLFYVAVQQLEGNLLIPVIQKSVVSLPPVLTVTAAVAMAVLFGFAGLVFATPLVVALMVFVRMVYIEDILGDRP